MVLAFDIAVPCPDLPDQRRPDWLGQGARSCPASRIAPAVCHDYRSTDGHSGAAARAGLEDALAASRSLGGIIPVMSSQAGFQRRPLTLLITKELVPTTRSARGRQPGAESRSVQRSPRVASTRRTCVMPPMRLDSSPIALRARIRARRISARHTVPKHRRRERARITVSEPVLCAAAAKRRRQATRYGCSMPTTRMLLKISATGVSILVDVPHQFEEPARNQHDERQSQ